MSRASGLTLVVESLVVPLLVAGHWSCGGEVSDSAKTAPSDKGGVGGRAVSSTGGALLTSGGVAAGSGGTTSSASGGAATSAGQGSVSSLGGVAGAGGTAVAGTINGAGAPGAFVPCACGESECGLCPSDKSVRIEAGEQSYRIDSTEVTNLDYATFLATNPSTLGQPLSCSWNGSFVPPNNWPATGQESLPVAWVDWCDAYAYCRWAKKRLCGKIGGGELPYASTRDSAASQWYHACSNAGAFLYPYGNTYDPERCNGKDRTTSASQALPVATQAGCEGGVPGLYDMSGNVWEWEDSCASATGPTDSCRLRGGSFWSETSLMDCPTATESYTRASVNKNIGFRCCGDE